MKKIPFIILLTITCWSCSLFEGDGENDNIPNLRELTPEEQELVSSTNQFAFDVFMNIQTKYSSENFFISPLSIEYALAMTLNGADGTTLDAIKSTLNTESMSESEINDAYQSLTEFLISLDKTVELSIANSVWNDNAYTVKSSFIDVMNTYYAAYVEGLDFSEPDAKNTINNWVNEETHGKIKELIDQIPPEAVMYLINAIYFKADWTYEFDESLTEKGDFFLDDGSKILVDMMTSNGAEINYYSNNTFQLIDIPYGNGQYYMTILLPSENESTSSVTELLSTTNLMEWLNGSNVITTQLIMPKFKIEFKTSLNEALSTLGMGIAFGDGADLSRLFEDPIDLFISRVLHKAVIEVDEKGSEAAAATAVEVSLTSADPGNPLTILIDRPFVFLIREKHSNHILFAGQLSNPS
ncbi:serpin family protein [Bacteroidota bacterium]